MKPYILGAVFARGGSKGLPGKNIKPLAGKPLVSYSIEIAKKIQCIDKIIVSTNSDEIAKVALTYGAEIPFMRPQELSTDDSPELFAWKHAVEVMEKLLGHDIDILVSIPATAPLRSQEDVEKCIEKLLNTDSDIIVTMTEAHRNSYFNMVKKDQDDTVHLVSSVDNVLPPFRRQDAPEMFDLTTVAFAMRSSYIKKTQSVLAGKVRAVIVPVERAIDIDTPLDFEIAEYLINRLKI